MFNEKIQEASTGFLSGKATLLTRYLEEDECCRIHRKVDSVDLGAGGCADWDVGSHPSIRALYDGSGCVERCHAELGALGYDRAFAQLALRADRKGAYLQGDMLQGLKKYSRGAYAGAHVYGRGYCYLARVRQGFRGRVARILGPVPLLADVLRMYNLVSEFGGREYEWRRVGEQLFHLALVRPAVESPMAAVNLFHAGIRLLEEHPCARVGLDPALGAEGFLGVRLGVVQDVELLEAVRASGSVRRVHDLLASLSVDVGQEYDLDIYTLVHTAGVMDSRIPGGVARLRRLALLGDRLLKVVLAVKGINEGLELGEISATESKVQSNVAMLRAAEQAGFVSMLMFAANVPRTSVRVVGTAVEALVAVVGQAHGLFGVRVVANKFSLL